MLEKREYPRYDKRLEVKYSTLGLTAVESSSVTENVSRTGIRFPVSRLIKKGDRLKVQIISPEKNGAPIEALGRIMWVSDVGNFDLDAGLHFTRINPLQAARLTGT